MFSGFNHTQAQVILDNQQELLAVSKFLCQMVNILSKNHPEVFKNSQEVLTALKEAEAIIEKRQHILEGVFS